MWVSRTKLESLERRLEKLENAVRYDESTDFTVYDPVQLEASRHGYYGQSIAAQKISVKDVVAKILDKLGMKMEYVMGQPARVNITEQPPAAGQRTSPEEK